MKKLTQQIAYLSEFMHEERFQQLQKVLSMRTRYITVCLENIYHAQNASAVIRSCEAFGVQDIHVADARNPFQTHEGIVKGTDKWVDIHRYETGENPTRDMLCHLKNQGYRIVATSPHADDRTPEDFDVQKQKFALVFGEEKDGISDTVREMADEFIKIPMYGFVESLNISVCAAILLQTLTHRLHSSDTDWMLSHPESTELLHRWMCYTLKDPDNILKRYEQQQEISDSMGSREQIFGEATV